MMRKKVQFWKPKRREWYLSIYYRYGIQQLVLDHTYIQNKDYPQIQFDFLECLFASEMIMLSQFIDERQQYNKVQSIQRNLSELFNIEIRISEGMTKFDLPEVNADVYYAHVIGNVSSGWLSHVVGFGGTSLSNIIWQKKENSESAFNKLLLSNQAIIDWLFNESPKGLNQLMCEEEFVCLTIDSELSIICNEDYDNNKIIHILNLISEIYGYTLIVGDVHISNK